jgi:hypothetical protein
MTIQAGLLAQGANIGAQVAASIASISPVAAYAQGVANRQQQDHDAAQLDLQNRQLAAQIQENDIDNKRADSQLMLQKANQDLTKLYQERTLELESKRVALEAARLDRDSHNQDRQFGLQKEELDLRKDANDSDKQYKSALIDKMKYEFDVSNPENQLKAAQTQLAQAQAQQAANPTPLSPQGQLAYDQINFPQLNITDPKSITANRRQENKLRSDFLKQSGDYFKVSDSYNRIQASGTTPSAAGDLALIFNYMKMLDPGSTVREGEFATAQNSGSVPAILVAKLNKVAAGERLSADQRADFMDRAAKLYAAQNQGYQQQKQQFTEIAVRQGLDPKNVIIDQVSNGTTSMSGSTSVPSFSPERLAARDQQYGLPPGTSARQVQMKQSLSGAVDDSSSDDYSVDDNGDEQDNY